MKPIGPMPAMAGVFADLARQLVAAEKKNGPDESRPQAVGSCPTQEAVEATVYHDTGRVMTYRHSRRWQFFWLGLVLGMSVSYLVVMTVVLPYIREAGL